jgi:hypothetical protein
MVGAGGEGAAEVDFVGAGVDGEGFGAEVEVEGTTHITNDKVVWNVPGARILFPTFFRANS